MMGKTPPGLSTDPREESPPTGPEGEAAPLTALDLDPEALRAVVEEVAQHFPAPFDETELVLMDVDPYRVHAYWHVAERDLSAADAETKAASPALVLRVHDVTPEAAEAWEPFDIEVRGLDSHCPVDLWQAGRAYEAELGVRARDGRFLALARSNRVETPAGGPAEVPSAPTVRQGAVGPPNPPAGPVQPAPGPPAGGDRPEAADEEPETPPPEPDARVTVEAARPSTAIARAEAPGPDAGLPRIDALPPPADRAALEAEDWPREAAQPAASPAWVAGSPVEAEPSPAVEPALAPQTEAGPRVGVEVGDVGLPEEPARAPAGTEPGPGFPRVDALAAPAAGTDLLAEAWPVEPALSLPAEALVPEFPNPAPPPPGAEALRPASPPRGPETPVPATLLPGAETPGLAPLPPGAEGPSPLSGGTVGGVALPDLGPPVGGPGAEAPAADHGPYGSGEGHSPLVSLSSSALAGAASLLEINAEIHLFGRAQPGSRLRLFGRPVALRPDGSFSVRVPLPEGAVVVPIELKGPEGS